MLYHCKMKTILNLHKMQNPLGTCWKSNIIQRQCQKQNCNPDFPALSTKVFSPHGWLQKKATKYSLPLSLLLGYAFTYHLRADSTVGHWWPWHKWRLEKCVHIGVCFPVALKTLSHEERVWDSLMKDDRARGEELRSPTNSLPMPEREWSHPRSASP